MFHKLSLLIALSLAASCSAPVRAEPAATPDGPEATDVTAIQRSNGFPGVPTDEESVQTLSARPGAMRVDDQDGRWTLIVRTDRRVVWEISREDGTYLEHPFAEFERIRDEEAERRRRTGADVAQVKDVARREALARELGVSPDGVDRVAMVNGSETRSIAGFDCVRTDVSLNGQAVVSVWSAPGTLAPVDPLDFYMAVGLLPTEVATALGQVTGFPMEVEVHLDVAGRRLDLASHVSSVDLTARVEDSAYDLPPGLKKVEREAPAPAAEVECSRAGCANRTTARSASTIYYRGRWRPFCSQACLDAVRDGTAGVR